MSIFIPRWEKYKSKKPDTSSEIDWSSPLSNGLRLAYVPTLTEKGPEIAFGTKFSYTNNSSYNSFGQDERGGYIESARSAGITLQALSPLSEIMGGSSLPQFTHMFGAAIESTASNRYGVCASRSSNLGLDSSNKLSVTVRKDGYADYKLVSYAFPSSAQPYAVYSGQWGGGAEEPPVLRRDGVTLASTIELNDSANAAYFPDSLSSGSALILLSGDSYGVGWRRGYFAYSWDRALDQEEDASIAEAPYQILKPRRKFWVMPSSATSVNLIVSSALHSQTANNIALVQQNTLSMQDSLNGQSVDNIGLIQQNILSANDASHSQTSNNIELSQSASIEVYESGQSQSSDNIDLIQQNTLAMQGADHSNSADSIGLIQSNVLDTQGALQSQSSDNIVLNIADVLIVSSPLHSVAADNIDLVQANVLVVHGVESAQNSGNIDLVQQSTLSINSSAHSQAAENIGLSQSIMLVVQEAGQAASVDNLDLVQSNILAVAGALQSISSDNIELIQSSTLIVSDALHTLISDNIALLDDDAVIITPTGRLFVVNSEERVFIVAAETRTYIVN